MGNVVHCISLIHDEVGIHLYRASSDGHSHHYDTQEKETNTRSTNSTKGIYVVPKHIPEKEVAYHGSTRIRRKEGTGEVKKPG